jgi:uncharacterized phage protein (TIGR01671 family)
MNREIKFRAWDKEKKVLMPVKLMDWSEWWVSCNPIGINGPLTYGERNSFKNEKTDRHILMQFTGLKDKNGREIYEGDFVKGHWWDRGKSHRHIGIVQYGMASFSVVGVKQYLGMSDLLNPTYEVIGNIYENPELLEVKS